MYEDQRLCSMVANYSGKSKRGISMAKKTPTSGQPKAPQEDFIQKHGKRIVVIIFSILIGDALPTIIQNGLDPDQIFYRIVLVSLPYTAAMVLVFLVWMREETKDQHPYQLLAGTFIILL